MYPVILLYAALNLHLCTQKNATLRAATTLPSCLNFVDWEKAMRDAPVRKDPYEIKEFRALRLPRSAEVCTQKANTASKS